MPKVLTEVPCGECGETKREWRCRRCGGECGEEGRSDMGQAYEITCLSCGEHYREYPDWSRYCNAGPAPSPDAGDLLRVVEEIRKSPGGRVLQRTYRCSVCGLPMVIERDGVGGFRPLDYVYDYDCPHCGATTEGRWSDLYRLAVKEQPSPSPSPPPEPDFWVLSDDESGLVGADVDREHLARRRRDLLLGHFSGIRIRPARYCDEE